eukprot:181890-Amorphochlora_amoeboformis.AAC.1
MQQEGKKFDDSDDELLDEITEAEKKKNKSKSNNKSPPKNTQTVGRGRVKDAGSPVSHRFR